MIAEFEQNCGVSSSGCSAQKRGVTGMRSTSPARRGGNLVSQRQETPPSHGPLPMTLPPTTTSPLASKHEATFVRSCSKMRWTQLSPLCNCVIWRNNHTDPISTKRTVAENMKARLARRTRTPNLARHQYTISTHRPWVDMSHEVCAMRAGTYRMAP